jgi:hypothetical protein
MPVLRGKKLSFFKKKIITTTTTATRGRRRRRKSARRGRREKASVACSDIRALSQTCNKIAEREKEREKERAKGGDRDEISTNREINLALILNEL